MRYSKEHKEQARSKLLHSGGRHAKKHGFSASGVQGLAAAAGVTTGSLYKHFSSKDDLFSAIIEEELAIAAGMYEGLEAASPKQAMDALAHYLSIRHVKHPDKGCPLPSLTPEIARAGKVVRATFQSGLQELHSRVSKVVGESDHAWTLIAQNVGAVMLARAMLNEAAQAELLEAVFRVGAKNLQLPIALSESSD